LGFQLSRFRTFGAKICACSGNPDRCGGLAAAFFCLSFLLFPMLLPPPPFISFRIATKTFVCSLIEVFEILIFVAFFKCVFLICLFSLSCEREGPLRSRYSIGRAHFRFFSSFILFPSSSYFQGCRPYSRVKVCTPLSLFYVSRICVFPVGSFFFLFLFVRKLKTVSLPPPSQ